MRKTALESYSRNDLKLLKYIRATCGELQFPRLLPTRFVPLALTPFNKIKGDQDRAFKTIHFTMHDFEFERLWKFPFRYLKIFREYDGVIGPDFSCFIEEDKLKVVNIWNVYRNRVVDNFLQQMGIDVIPTVVFGSLADLSWALEGIPKNSNICIPTVGAIQGEKRQDFIQCFEKVIQILNPSKVIVIGSLPQELEKYRDIIVQFDSPTASYLKLKGCQEQQKEIK